MSWSEIRRDEARKLLHRAQQKFEDECGISMADGMGRYWHELAAEISASLRIPTIGIGAGNRTDGQVLVMQDLLGLSSDFKPKFVRKYLDGRSVWLKAFNAYANDVKNGSFPAADESYGQ